MIIKKIFMFYEFLKKLINPAFYKFLSEILISFFEELILLIKEKKLQNNKKKLLIEQDNLENKNEEKPLEKMEIKKNDNF